MTARTHGQYRLLPAGVWEISADPDVMILLKRVFPRLSPTTRGTLTISSTAEVARNLEWFTDRWPMRASAEDRRRLRGLANDHRRAERLVEQVIAGKEMVPTGGPGWVSSSMPLRPPQRTARDLVWASGGVLIADALGAGKTLMGLALLENPEARPALAVTLTGQMPGQWRSEIKKFYPTLTSLELQTGPIHSLQRHGRTADLIVCNYAKLAKWQHHLKGVVKTVIFDEAHELRGETSDRYKAAVTIARQAHWRAALTGTPVYNYGANELYNILDCVRPGALGSRAEFAREWCGGAYSLGPKTRVENSAAFRTHLKSQGLFLRRPLSELGITLPPAHVIEQEVPSDPEALRQIEGNAVELARLILDQSASPRARWEAAGRFDWMLRRSTGIAKAPFVADFVRMLLQREQRVMLFGYHLACHHLWAERLADFRPVFYTGEQSDGQKAQALREFKSGRSRLLVMSVRSGAGLDGLQMYTRTLVFGELDWSPATHTQAIGRVLRPGQKDDVFAYFCTTSTGADPVMLETLDVKKLQYRSIVQADDDDFDDEGALEPVAQIDRTEQIRRVAATYLEQVAQRKTA